MTSLSLLPKTMLREIFLGTPDDIFQLSTNVLVSASQPSCVWYSWHELAEWTCFILFIYLLSTRPLLSCSRKRGDQTLKKWIILKYYFHQRWQSSASEEGAKTASWWWRRVQCLSNIWWCSGMMIVIIMCCQCSHVSGVRWPRLLQQILQVWEWNHESGDLWEWFVVWPRDGADWWNPQLLCLQLESGVWRQSC